MYSRFCTQYCLLAVLVTATNADVMVESLHGSFVPWRFFPRAPTDNSEVAVRLKNINDTAYVATVLMGTPQQQVSMSASLSQDYISVASPPSSADNVTSYYNPGTSTTYMPSNDLATIQTLSGRTVSGHFAGETCTLKWTSQSFTYNASIVLTDSSVTNDLYPSAARGILGYGVNLQPGSPPNASLIHSYLPANFTSAVCGIELNHMDDPVPDGILTMGKVDSNAFTGNFTNVMVPSDSKTSWSVPFDRLTYSVNGTAQNMSGLLASIDIMYTDIQVSTDMARRIYSGIPGCQAISDTIWSLPCNSTFSISLTFSGKSFTISERDTIRKLPNGTCYGVVTGGAQNNIAQVGAPFLRNVYTQFGAQNASNGSVDFFVGFATKNLRQSPNSTAVASPTSTAASGATWIMGRDIGLLSTFAAVLIAVF